MVGVEEARARMCACIAALCSEPVALAAAVGRTLAETLTAERDQPPFRSSAMDGYALRAADLAGGLGVSGFRVVGQSAAGMPYAGAIGAGEAVRIFTGAPVPQGADWVVPQEGTRLEGAALIVDDQLQRSANIRAVATDFRAGERLIAAGTRLNARHVALIAAAGVPAVNVSRIPRVGLLATGTEILAPGAPAGPYQIYDSVTFGLAAMIEGWGGHALRRGASSRRGRRGRGGGGARTRRCGSAGDRRRRIGGRLRCGEARADVLGALRSWCRRSRCVPASRPGSAR